MTQVFVKKEKHIENSGKLVYAVTPQLIFFLQNLATRQSWHGQEIKIDLNGFERF